MKSLLLSLPHLAYISMRLHNHSVAVRLIFLLSAISGVTIASTLQQPLLNPETQLTESTSSWNFNFSSSAPHYFASVYGLLQQWPNTFFPNGHSIAPCEIPAFTKLYHGRTDGEVPPSPEWIAFDMFVPIPFKHSLSRSSTNLSQRNELRHNGRLPQLPHANVPNHASCKMHLLRRRIRHTHGLRPTRYANATYLRQYLRCFAAWRRVPGLVG